ncbi:MAG: DNA repair protein RadA, partial [Candidatus Cloacimonadota bacterium]
MFFCTECGAETGKWAGKCPACGAWNTLKETSRVIGKTKNTRLEFVPSSKPEQIKDIKVNKSIRMTTTIGELDGTLGGGIVPGMVVLIGGEPGIGKSTLMMQVSDKIAGSEKKVLYVSGEESREQIKLRSERLKCKSENLLLFCTTEVEEIIQAVENVEPDIVIVDSIQSVYLSSMENAPGSITQLRECTSTFTRLAKQKNIPFFLIGHVTKDGAVAGPKIIEHMVDTVLYFEGEMKNQFK